MDDHYVPHLSQTELAWAAGFFDGEGHIGYGEYGKYKTRKLVAVVAGSHLPSLWRFQEAVMGRGKIYDGPGVNKPTWQWRVGSFEDVQAVTAMLWPFLCEERQVQFIQKMCKYLRRPEPENLKSENLRRFEELVIDWKAIKELNKRNLPFDDLPKVRASISLE